MLRWLFWIIGAAAIWPVLSQEASNNYATPLPSGRIVGGNQVSIANFPYQLSLQIDGAHICGASVVAPRWALTAGHCCFGLNLTDLTLRGGSANHKEGGVLFALDKLVIHPDYDDDNLNFDVCMMRIETSFLGYANISILPITNSGTIPSDMQGTVSGWGSIVSDGEVVSKLRATSVKILSPTACTKQTRKYVTTTASMFCAGNVGRSICVGDSGGPLVFEQRQIGIVSFIITECGGTAPAVYTRISNKSVREFIQQQMSSGDRPSEIRARS